MDPLTIASTSVSFATCGGQALKGIQVLCSFISDIKDAPAKVRQLSATLQTLRQSIEETQTYHCSTSQPEAMHPALHDAAQLCDDIVGPLSARIARYQERLTSDSAVAKRWAQVDVAFRGYRIEKTIQALQHARTALLDARMMQLRLNFSEMLRKQEYLVSALATATDRHGRELEANMKLTLDISQNSQAQLGEAAAQIRGKIDENRQQIVALGQKINHLTRSGSIGVNTIVSDTTVSKLAPDCVERLTQKVSQLTFDVDHVRSAVTRLLRQQRTPDNLVDVAFERAVSEAVANELHGLSKQAADDDQDACRITRVEDVSETSSGRASSEADMRFRTRLRYSYQKRFWFGHLSIMSIQTDKANTENPEAIYSSVRTDVIFTPVSWLSQWTPRLQLVKLMLARQQHTQNTWSIRVSKVLRPEDSVPLSELLLYGTFEQFRDKVQSCKIRANDLIPVAGGTVTLLKVCVDWLMAVGISDRDFSAGKDVFSHFLHENFSPCSSVEETGRAILRVGGARPTRRAEVTRLAAKICLWLVESETCHEIVWMPQFLVEMMAACDNECHDIFQRLFTQIAARSRFSEARVFGGKPQFVDIEDMISLAIQGNGRESQYMEIFSILHAMWNSSAYSKLGTLLSSENTSDMLYKQSICLDRTLALVSVAMDAKVWLVGDKAMLTLAQKRLFDTIRGALSLASPLSRNPLEGLLRGNIFISGLTIPIPQMTWAGTPRQQYYKIMSDVIAALISLDTSVATLRIGNYTLTDAAVQWQVLDLWAQSLTIAGISPSDVFPPDNERGMRRLIGSTYSPLVYKSTSDGATLAITRDVSTNRTCLVMNEVRNPLHPKLAECHPGFVASRDGEEEDRRNILEKLTKDWRYQTRCDDRGRGVHCQITTSPLTVAEGVLEDEVVDGEPVENTFFRYPDGGIYELKPMLDEEGNQTLELIIEIDDIDAPWDRLCGEIKDYGQYRSTGGGHLMYNPMEGYGELEHGGQADQPGDGGSHPITSSSGGKGLEDEGSKDGIDEAGEQYDGTEFDPLQNVAVAAGWV